MSIAKLSLYAAVLALGHFCNPAAAQRQETINSLLDKGLEIKAAEAGQLYLQKGKEAFVCLQHGPCASLRVFRLACATDFLQQKNFSERNPQSATRIAIPAGTEVIELHDDEPTAGFLKVGVPKGPPNGSGWVALTAFDASRCPGASKP
jgi:hypothetical protein